MKHANPSSAVLASLTVPQLQSQPMAAAPAGTFKGYVENGTHSHASTSTVECAETSFAMDRLTGCAWRRGWCAPHLSNLITNVLLVNRTGTNIWLGIPYGEPPVGPLRWMPTVKKAPLDTPLEATSFGHDCAQIGA
eukprot:SAG11_NODE_755_length_7329_cov_6.741355_1_plen_136_part_00